MLYSEMVEGCWKGPETKGEAAIHACAYPSNSKYTTFTITMTYAEKRC